MARKQEIEISTRLGRRRIDMEKVIYFPRGLAGFEGLHEFTLLQIRPDAPLLVLQSMDKPAVGLLVADPFSFMDDYRIKVSDAEQKLLRLKNVRQVAVLVTVSIPSGKPEETVLNLTGPILVNHQARVGLQIPQSEGQTPSQMRLHGLTARADKAQMEEQAARERDELSQAAPDHSQEAAAAKSTTAAPPAQKPEPAAVAAAKAAARAAASTAGKAAATMGANEAPATKVRSRAKKSTAE